MILVMCFFGFLFESKYMNVVTWGGGEQFLTGLMDSSQFDVWAEWELLLDNNIFFVWFAFINYKCLS